MTDFKYPRRFDIITGPPVKKVYYTDAEQFAWEAQQEAQQEAEKARAPMVAEVQKRADISAERDRLLRTGFLYDFPDGVTGVVEIRHADDKVHINGIASNGSILVAQGDTTTQAGFYIDQADAQHFFTGPEAVNFGVAVQEFIGGLYAAASAHKRAVTAILDDPALGNADKTEAIQGYDFSAGWPEY